MVKYRTFTVDKRSDSIMYILNKRMGAPDFDSYTPVEVIELIDKKAYDELIRLLEKLRGKIPCDHEFSPECNGCSADMLINDVLQDRS